MNQASRLLASGALRDLLRVISRGEGGVIDDETMQTAIQTLSPTFFQSIFENKVVRIHGEPFRTAFAKACAATGNVKLFRQICPDMSKLQDLIQSDEMVMTAVLKNQLEFVKMLHEAGVSFEQRNSKAWGLLEQAVWHGCLDVARYLRDEMHHKPADITSKPLSHTMVHKPVDRKHRVLVHLGYRRSPTLPAFRLTSDASVTLMEAVQQGLVHLEVQDLRLVDSMQFIPIKELNTVKEGKEWMWSYPSTQRSSLKFNLVNTSNQAVLASTMTSFETMAVKGMWLEDTESGGRSVVYMYEKEQVVAELVVEWFVFRPCSFELKGVETIWDSKKTLCIGHRGAGMNRGLTEGKGKLQLGENTLMSFEEAQRAGAKWVEFDVHLTKDDVPVIYHDWTMSELSVERRVRDLTKKEFMMVHPAGRAGLGPLYEASVVRRNQQTVDDSVLVKRGIQVSECNGKWPWKGNGDGTIQSCFTTLAEMLQKLDESLCFNVEIKYPFAYEARQNGLQVADLNRYIDSVLEVMNRYGKHRRMIISSFHPECVIAARWKQDKWPVLLLTEAGQFVTPDPRCNSYAAALSFCLMYGVDGIVTDVTPLLMTAGAVAEAFHVHDLLLLSYGGLNNDARNVKVQLDCGLDAVILDDVRPLASSFPSP